MSDTQWPRYEVFIQERSGKPHRSIGTVHAPDPEMALLNGRDLFARRPSCHSLWVAPADAILAKTREELPAASAWKRPTSPSPTDQETYLVFVKQSQRRAMGFVEHIGSLQASTSLEALDLAVARYGSSDPFVWWICPENAVTRSDENDIESMFEPANQKCYRHPNQYRTVEAMRQVERSTQFAAPGDKDKAT